MEKLKLKVEVLCQKSRKGKAGEWEIPIPTGGGERHTSAPIFLFY